jgi:hypothetical protein
MSIGGCAHGSHNAGRPGRQGRNLLVNGDLAETVDAVEAGLAEGDPQICHRNGVLYVALPGGRARANAALLRVHTMRLASFYKMAFKPNCHFKPVDPPLRYVEALLCKGEWKFPPLKAGGVGADR